MSNIVTVTFAFETYTFKTDVPASKICGDHGQPTKKMNEWLTKKFSGIYDEDDIFGCDISVKSTNRMETIKF